MAGTQTMAAPPTGSIDRTAASTPKTSGEGSEAMAKAMPTRLPWNRAVSVIPRTMARVTPGDLLEQALLAVLVEWDERRAPART